MKWRSVEKVKKGEVEKWNVEMKCRVEVLKWRSVKKVKGKKSEMKWRCVEKVKWKKNEMKKCLGEVLKRRSVEKLKWRKIVKWNEEVSGWSVEMKKC